MQDKCNSGKWSEYEVRAKRLGKHKYSRRGNSEAYQNPVRTSIIQYFFEHIKARIKGIQNMGYSRQNDHKEKWRYHDTRRKKRKKREYDVLLEGETIFPRRTRSKHQYSREE